MDCPWSPFVRNVLEFSRSILHPACVPPVIRIRSFTYIHLAIVFGVWRGPHRSRPRAQRRGDKLGRCPCPEGPPVNLSRTVPSPSRGSLWTTLAPEDRGRESPGTRNDKWRFPRRYLFFVFRSAATFKLRCSLDASTAREMLAGPVEVFGVVTALFSPWRSPLSPVLLWSICARPTARSPLSVFSES